MVPIVASVRDFYYLQRNAELPYVAGTCTTCAKQGEFESAFEHVNGTVETMGKRCLVCLLSENNCFTDDVCEAIGGSIYYNEDIE